MDWISVKERYPDAELIQCKRKAASINLDWVEDEKFPCLVRLNNEQGEPYCMIAFYEGNEMFSARGDILYDVTDWASIQRIIWGSGKNENVRQKPLWETVETGRCRHCMFHPDWYEHPSSAVRHLRDKCPMYMFDTYDEGDWWRGEDDGYCHEFKPYEEEKVMKVMLDEWAIRPTRAHNTDAGLDLRTPITFTIGPGERSTVDTGVHVQLPEGTVGLILSKSGLNAKYGITCEGVIDEGYTGSIKATLHNHGGQTVKFVAGEKITQLIVAPCLYVNVEIVDELEDTERGAQGFGSTGR